nr:4-oxalocrotonate tautomerase family protein [Azospirillum sp. B510]
MNIKITREGATPDQKAELIRGVTGLLVEVLDKTPATTFVVIDEVDMEDWGVGGLAVFPSRSTGKPSAPERRFPANAGLEGRGGAILP